MSAEANKARDHEGRTGIFRGRTLSGYFVLLLLAVSPSAAQVFLPDDPLWVDPDTLAISPPAERSLSDTFDFFANTFGSPGEHEGPALNVNTLGEVPNSTWYTNRHYLHPMPLEALQRGPDTAAGPSEEAPWKVVGLTSEGKTPRLLMVDARGDRYLLKFDPKAYPEISTAAEIIATKFFHAFGYNVPENYLVYFEPGQLETAAGSGLTPRDLARIVHKAPRYPDGTYRALASRLPEGEPLGPFLYHGTRPDDPNDIFSHEARRELRGLRVFSAFLNRDDARNLNSLDVLAGTSARQYIRHFLVEFSATLGGGPLGPKPRWAGHEYAVEAGPIAARTLTLGFGGPAWMDIVYPDLPSVGHLEAKHFDPKSWVPQVPNPAFERMDAADAFWAARQVMNLSDDAIRAIVATGGYTYPRAEAYVTETLMQRRDKIGRAYLSFAGGLDRFRVEDSLLVFEDLQATYGFTEPGRLRRISWFVFDNLTGEGGLPLATVTTAEESLPLPEAVAPFLKAEIETPGEGITTVYLRYTEAGYVVVGIERKAA